MTIGSGCGPFEQQVPVRVARANTSGGGGVGRQAKQQNRRCTPIRPVFRLACGADEPPQPSHCAHRMGGAMITRPGEHRNRHGFRHAAPILPEVELRQDVRPHQPNEPIPRVAPGECHNGIHCEARAGMRFEVADLDACTPCRHPRRRQAGRIGRHAFCRLQRIAWRDEPPDLVQVQCLHRCKAKPPMAAMSRIEGSAEKSDAFQSTFAASMSRHP